MSNHDQQHQHHKEEHEQERKEKKHEEREREQHPSGPKPLIHPKWLLVIGILLMLGVVLVWTIF